MSVSRNQRYRQFFFFGEKITTPIHMGKWLGGPPEKTPELWDMLRYGLIKGHVSLMAAEDWNSEPWPLENNSPLLLMATRNPGSENQVVAKGSCYPIIYKVQVVIARFLNHQQLSLEMIQLFEEHLFARVETSIDRSHRRVHVAHSWFSSRYRPPLRHTTRTLVLPYDIGSTILPIPPKNTVRQKSPPRRERLSQKGNTPCCHNRGNSIGLLWWRRYSKIPFL